MYAGIPAGTTYGRLTVLEYRGTYDVLVRCACGAEKAVAAQALRDGATRSCGCLRRETCSATGKAGATHGLSDTPEYRAWANAKRRIFNPACEAYSDYGGRGLTMDPEWAESFEAFLAEVGPRPAAHLSIDRIDNDLGYVPGNLRWATPIEQSNNRRPNRGWYRRAA